MKSDPELIQELNIFHHEEAAQRLAMPSTERWSAYWNGLNWQKLRELEAPKNTPTKAISKEQQP